MGILPVLDILDGEVVHGQQGERDSYAPIKSELTDSSLPKEIAKCLNNDFGFKKFYVADLDSIMGLGDNFEVLKELNQEFGFDLLVDCGFEYKEDIFENKSILEHFDSLIMGTESIKSFEVVKAALNELGEDNLIISIDIKSGNILSNMGELKDVFSAVNKFSDLGVKRFIILDLGKVGSLSGSNTDIENMRDEVPRKDIEFITGGGVRNYGDVKKILGKGFSKVLVATALHNKNISPEEL